MRIVCPWLVAGPTPPTAHARGVARGRPNWWVILAVSLALMALLVATAGGTPRSAGHRVGGPAEPGGAPLTAPARRRTGVAATATVAASRPRRPRPPPRRPRRNRLGVRPAGGVRHVSPRDARHRRRTPQTAAPASPRRRLAPPRPRPRRRRPEPQRCRPTARRRRATSTPRSGLEPVRVHRHRRHGDLGRVVRRHLSDHGGQCPSGGQTSAGPRPWRRRSLTPAGAASPR